MKDTVKKITPTTISIDTKTEALRELREEEATIMLTESGEEVTVGQALMFVDLDYYAFETERNVLSELLATTSHEIDGRAETLWDRLKILAENFVDGVLRVAGVRTNELCVGNTCVDEEAFLRMVQSANVSGSTETDSSDTTLPPSDTPTDTTEPTDDSSSGDSNVGTTTEEVVPDTQTSGEVSAPQSSEGEVDVSGSEESAVVEISEPAAETNAADEPPSEQAAEPTI